jgi:hypothetical protein
MKQKRVKAMKAREKSGGAFVYPTEDELRAEEEEVKPALIFTVYDANGKIMRKLNAPVSKGYKSIAWDLRYLTSRGPRVAPGEYKVAIDKNDEGKVTRLVEPQSFTVKALPNALGTPDYKANFAFYQEATDLNGEITSARGKINEMEERLESIEKILETMPVEAASLEPKIKGLKDEIKEVTKVILGGSGAQNSASSRLRFALYAGSSAEVNITGAMKEQYSLAKELYDSKASELETLYKTKVPALEEEFEDMGGKLYNTPPRRGWFFENDY